MLKLGFKHSPHDCRYTFAYLADKYSINEICKKIIMEHALPTKDNSAWKTKGKSDVTSGVCTEKTLTDLLEQINKIK